MADQDLQIREGPSHPDPKIRRGRGSPKTFVWPFGPRFSLTIRGGRGGIRHSFHNVINQGKSRRNSLDRVYSNFTLFLTTRS